MLERDPDLGRVVIGRLAEEFGRVGRLEAVDDVLGAIGQRSEIFLGRGALGPQQARSKTSDIERYIGRR